jgi:putative sterol carrier protein
MNTREFFEDHLPARLNEEVAKRAGCSFQFVIEDSEAPNWGVDFKRASDWIVEGKLDAPDCTIRVKEADFTKIATKQLKPEMAVMLGKIKIDGDLKYAFKLKEMMG